MKPFLCGAYTAMILTLPLAGAAAQLPPAALEPHLLHTLKGHTGDAPPAMALSHDGKSLVSAGRDNTFKLWDVATGKQIASWQATVVTERSFINTVAYSPKGKTVASTGLLATIIQLWDAATGKPSAKLGAGGSGVLVAGFSPDGKTLASIISADTERVMLWDVASGKPKATLRGIKGRMSSSSSVRFSPDGKTLAAVGEQDPAIHLWDVASGKKIAAWEGHLFGSWTVAFSPDGKILASGGANKVGPKEPIPVSLPVPAESQDKPSRGDIRLWDVAAGQLRATLKGHSSSVYFLEFSPDGKRLASVGTDMTVRLWDVASGQNVALLNMDHKSSLDAPSRALLLTFSPDGRLLAASPASLGARREDMNNIYLWELKPAK